MSKEQDFSKTKRYGMMTKTWFEETYKDMGECSYGEYVRYSDFKDLLEAKSPKRQASFSELKKLIKKEIKTLENAAFTVFKEKNEINYGYAVAQYERAMMFLKVLHRIEELTKNNI